MKKRVEKNPIFQTHLKTKPMLLSPEIHDLALVVLLHIDLEVGYSSLPCSAP